MAVTVRINFVSNAQKAISKGISSVNKLKDKTKTSSKEMKASWKEVALAVGAAIIAYQQISRVVTGLIGTYEKQAKAEIKLEGALRATGHAAGYSADSLKMMAVEMSELTGIADEAVIEAEAIMLTFTKIGKEVFPQALEAAADMSTMFGQDLQQSVIQLGTALNDPIAGVGRLKRIGISFTEDQKNMIKSFTEANDIMGAQKVILDELAAEFGGVAVAMGQSALGQVNNLNNAWVDMQEKVGEVLLEALLPLIQAMHEFIAFLDSNMDTIHMLGSALAFIGSVVLNVIKFIITFKEAIIAFIAIAFGVPAVLGAISTAMTILNTVILANPIGLLIAGIVAAISVIGGLVAAAEKAEKAFQDLKKETNELARGVLKDAAEGMVKDLGKMQAALSQVEAQYDKIEKQAMTANEEQLSGMLDLISTLAKLKKGIQEQIKLREEQIKLEEEAAAQAELLKKRAELEEEYFKKYSRLVDSKISLLEEERQEAIAKAEEIGASIFSINLFYNEQIRRENEKTIKARESFEKQFIDKLDALTLSRLELLEKEKEEAIEAAREKGANELIVVEYYQQLIGEERKRANNEAFESEKDNLNKLEAEYRRHAEERAKFQTDVIGYITSLANEFTLSQSENLKAQKDQEINHLEDLGDAWLREIKSRLSYTEQMQEGLIVQGDAENALEIAKEIEEAESLILAAKNQISENYASQIGYALQEERLAKQVGKVYLDNFSILQSVSGEMKAQTEIQREAIKEQISSLESLVGGLNLKAQSMDFVESLGIRSIIDQAKAAVVYLQEKLSLIPTDIEKAFADLIKKVGVISAKYQDPLEKKKAVIQAEIKAVNAYQSELEKRLKLQEDALRGIRYGTEAWEEQQGAINDMRGAVASASELANTLNRELATVDDDIQKEGQVDYAAEAASFALEGLAQVANFLFEQLVSLITSTAEFQKYMADFGVLLEQIASNAVVPLLQALQPLVQVVLAVVKVLFDVLVPVFKMLGVLIASLMPLWVALGNLIIQIVALLQALAPLIFVLIQIVGNVLAPIITALSEVFKVLGFIIDALNPVFEIVAHVADGLGRVLRSLLAIVGFIISPFKALGELIYYIVSFKWDKIGNISVTTPGDLAKQLQDIWKSPWTGLGDYKKFGIDPGDVPTLEMTLDDINKLDGEAFGATVYGGNVSVNQAPDIYVYQTFAGNVIGDGGLVEVGQFVVDAIQEYLGAGGKVEFLEGEG